MSWTTFDYHPRPKPSNLRSMRVLGVRDVVVYCGNPPKCYHQARLNGLDLAFSKSGQCIRAKSPNKPAALQWRLWLRVPIKVIPVRACVAVRQIETAKSKKRISRKRVRRFEATFHKGRLGHDAPHADNRTGRRLFFFFYNDLRLDKLALSVVCRSQEQVVETGQVLSMSELFHGTHS